MVALEPMPQVCTSNVSDLGCGQYTMPQSLNAHRSLICTFVAYVVAEEWHTSIREILPRPSWHADRGGPRLPVLHMTVCGDASDGDDVIEFAYHREYVTIHHISGGIKCTDRRRMHRVCTGVIW